MIKRQHDQQREADCGGQSEGKQAIEQFEAGALSGGIPWLVAGSWGRALVFTHLGAPRRDPFGRREWPVQCQR